MTTSEVDGGELHPSIEGLLRWFDATHLPPHLRAVVNPLGEYAREQASELPWSRQLSDGLAKLIEAKDCLVRAAIIGAERT